MYQLDSSSCTNVVTITQTIFNVNFTKLFSKDEELVKEGNSFTNISVEKTSLSIQYIRAKSNFIGDCQFSLTIRASSKQWPNILFTKLSSESFLFKALFIAFQALESSLQFVPEFNGISLTFVLACALQQNKTLRFRGQPE